MNIGIFIDIFFNTQKYKDPGTISLSLFNLGFKIKIYTFNTDSPIFSGIQVKKINKAESQSHLFWQKEKIDCVIVYSWLSLRFSKMIDALKLSDKKIILKLDSDGRLLPPLKPSYLRIIGKNNSLKEICIYLLRQLQWSILSSLNSRRKIKQLEAANAVIIESPQALYNLQKSLSFLKHDELINKIHFVPDPINSKTADGKNLSLIKENAIICLGRWNDKQKNKSILIKTLKAFKNPGWKIIIIGTGATHIKKNGFQIDVETIEQVKHHLIFEYFKKSKIFFAPSKFESFNLAAAEALTCGCSLCGTPLESFRYFTDNGRFGSLASDFTLASIKSALKTDVEKWEQNLYNQDYTASYWQQELAPEKIAKQIENIIKQVQG